MSLNHWVRDSLMYRTFLRLSLAVQILTQPGGGWTQICNAFSTVSDFCVDSSLSASALALRGPFVLFAGGCGLNVSVVSPGVDASVVLPGRTPLVRCFDGTHHYLSNDPACRGPGSSATGAASQHAAVPDEPLGCAASARDSNLARALRLCRVVGSENDTKVESRALPQPPPPSSIPVRAKKPQLRYAGTLSLRSSPTLSSVDPDGVVGAYPVLAAGTFYHVLDGPCSPGDTDHGTLGYVR
jgi:hypothetical protein